jgi:PPOX class probable F420-dependent enzyme
MLVGPPTMASRPEDHSAKAMPALPDELRELIESGPMAHLSTINPDGSPQVSVIWIGLDGGDLVSTHMRDNVKLRNIRRDPRVALSFDLPREPGVWINPYAAVYARATVEPSSRIWDLMTKHAKVYVSPDAEVPVPEESEPGFIVRYSITRIGGIGPWASSPAL